MVDGLVALPLAQIEPRLFRRRQEDPSGAQEPFLSALDVWIRLSSSLFHWLFVSPDVATLTPISPPPSSLWANCSMTSRLPLDQRVNAIDDRVAVLEQSNKAQQKQLPPSQPPQKPVRGPGRAIVASALVVTGGLGFSIVKGCTTLASALPSAGREGLRDAGIITAQSIRTAGESIGSKLQTGIREPLAWGASGAAGLMAVAAIVKRGR